MDKPFPNLRHLRAFREVALCRSISQASGRVHLSQPAITQAIAKLEQTLGTALFDRRNDGMFTTDQGQQYLARVERAITFLERGARETLKLDQKRGTKGFGNFDRLLTTTQLRALIAVSGSENFSLAAKKIGIAQPSLHRAARDLERLSGVKLFEKVSQGIALTPAARALVQHAKLALAELQQGFVEIEELKGVDSACIVVGSMPLARVFVLPRAINRLAELRPDVQVNVIDGPYDDLLHGLRNGEIDVLIGALRNPVPIDDVVQETLFSDPLAIAGRVGHPLIDVETILIADLARYPWIVPRRGTPTRDYFEKIFADQDEPPPHIETSSLILMRGLLLESDRLALTSAHQIRHELLQGLFDTLNMDMNTTARPIGLTLRQDWRPTASQQVFLDSLREAGMNMTSSAS